MNLSPPMSMNAEQQPEDEQKVRFDSDLTEVKEVAPIPEEVKPKYWINDDDMLRNEREITTTLNKCFHDTIEEDDKEYCVRGLEGLIHEEADGSERIVEHREEVLLEFDKQKLCSTYRRYLDWRSWKKVRKVSRSISSASRETALAMAQADEEWVLDNVAPSEDSEKKSEKRSNIVAKFFRRFSRKK